MEHDEDPERTLYPRRQISYIIIYCNRYEIGAVDSADRASGQAGLTELVKVDKRRLTTILPLVRVRLNLEIVGWLRLRKGL